MVIAVYARIQAAIYTSDIIIDMGIIAEPCSLGLTPTASVAVMASISHALTLVLMERKNVTRRDYGLRHHGGYLGSMAREDNEAAG